MAESASVPSLATPGPARPAPVMNLPIGWSEHKAPGGQLYWYNQQTKVSTYVRPVPAIFPPPPPAGFRPPPCAESGSQQATAAAGGPLGQFSAPLHSSLTGNNVSPASLLSIPTTVAPVKKEKEKEKKEKPLIKTPMGNSEWTRVVTNKGNTFFTNRETKESVWTVPDDIKELVATFVAEEKRAAAVASGVKRKAEEEAAAALVTPDLTVDEVQKRIQEIQSRTQTDKDLSGAGATPEPPAKRKRIKEKVVGSLKDLGHAERGALLDDWQTMDTAAPAVDEVNKVDEGYLMHQIAQNEVASNEKAAVAGPSGGTTTATIAPLIVPSAPLLAASAVSAEEGMALFRTMLVEKDILPLSPWDDELLKFIDDPRYLAVKSMKDRRDLFDQYCKELLRAQRAAKKLTLEAGGVKANPLTAYRALLSTAVLSTRTHFSDFKRSHSKDPRFREFGKTEGEKEKVFKSWLKELGERKRGEAKLGEERFGQMLTEDSSITADDKWTEIKTRFVSDPRYEAVPSSSLRETLFNTHIAALAATPQDLAAAKADKAAKAMASLKEREEQVRRDSERSARNAQMARGALGREEGERDFSTLLIDAVRDHEAQWQLVASGLERDARFQSNSLSVNDKRRLFDQHISTLYTKRLAVVEGLFSDHTPLLTTPFSAVLPAISSSQHVTRMVHSDFDKLEEMYTAWLQRRTQSARREFDDLLRENPSLEFWGRLQKDTVSGEKVKRDEEEEDEGDAADDAIDLKTMAGQIDLAAIQATLKHDKRYLIFDHQPEERTRWIEEYVAALTAPKLTVHQR